MGNTPSRRKSRRSQPPQQGQVLDELPTGNDEDWWKCEKCDLSNRPQARYCRRCGQARIPNDILTEEVTLEKAQISDEMQEKMVRSLLRSSGASAPPEGQLRIGLWGPKYAGKTTYIITVYGACLSSDSNWIARLEDEASTNLVVEGLASLRGWERDDVSLGNFPAATVPGPRPTYYRYFFAPYTPKDKKRKRRRSQPSSFWEWLKSDEPPPSHPVTPRELVVSFADVSGESYADEPLDSELWEHIATCRGLLCLLDPDTARSSFKITLKLVQSLWNKLREEYPDNLVGNWLPHYIAFCFTKMDKGKELYQFIDQPRELLKKLERETAFNLDRLLRQYVLEDRLKYFTISSIGVDEKGESLVDPKDDKIILNPEKIRPINILQPLRWLFQTMKV